MPAAGIGSSTDLENYIFGNRYLFIYSVPLFLAGAISFGDYVRRLSKPIVYILISGTLVFGILNMVVYPGFDSFISNKSRDKFYNMTDPAIKKASDNNFILPDLRSDLFFKNQKIELSRAINVKKDAPNYRLVFKSPNNLSSYECSRLKKDALVSEWLNLYNKDWCH